VVPRDQDRRPRDPPPEQRPLPLRPQVPGEQGARGPPGDEEDEGGLVPRVAGIRALRMQDSQAQPPEAQALPRPRRADGGPAPERLLVGLCPSAPLPAPRRADDRRRAGGGEDGTRAAGVVRVGVAEKQRREAPDPPVAQLGRHHPLAHVEGAPREAPCVHQQRVAVRLDEDRAALPHVDQREPRRPGRRRIGRKGMHDERPRRGEEQRERDATRAPSPPPRRDRREQEVVGRRQGKRGRGHGPRARLAQERAAPEQSVGHKGRRHAQKGRRLREQVPHDGERRAARDQEGGRRDRSEVRERRVRRDDPEAGQALGQRRRLRGQRAGEQGAERPGEASEAALDPRRQGDEPSRGQEGEAEGGIVERVGLGEQQEEGRDAERVGEAPTPVGDPPHERHDHQERRPEHRDPGARERGVEEHRGHANDSRGSRAGAQPPERAVGEERHEAHVEPRHREHVGGPRAQERAPVLLGQPSAVAEQERLDEGAGAGPLRQPGPDPSARSAPRPLHPEPRPRRGSARQPRHQQRALHPARQQHPAAAEPARVVEGAAVAEAAGDTQPRPRPDPLPAAQLQRARLRRQREAEPQRAHHAGSPSLQPLCPNEQSELRAAPLGVAQERPDDRHRPPLPSLGQRREPLVAAEGAPRARQGDGQEKRRPDRARAEPPDERPEEREEDEREDRPAAGRARHGEAREQGSRGDGERRRDHRIAHRLPWGSGRDGRSNQYE
jgi:hypothetical protein